SSARGSPWTTSVRAASTSTRRCPSELPDASRLPGSCARAGKPGNVDPGGPREEVRAISVCFRCDGPIEWVTTARGKKLPLNPGATVGARGNFVIFEGLAEYIHGDERDGFRELGYDVREAHQATCGR